jgi:hypothetical protein
MTGFTLCPLRTATAAMEAPEPIENMKLVQDAYFTSYEDLSIHELMLKDKVEFSFLSKVFLLKLFSLLR